MGVLADIDGNEIVVKTETRHKELMNQLPGARYDNVNRHRWTIPATWAACKALRGLFGEELEVGSGLAEWSRSEYQDHILPSLDARLKLDAPGDPDLYPFQRAGVEFITAAERVLICDDMGTGKTVQSIRSLARATVEGKQAFPAVVVCPNSMKLTWKREFARWWPGIQVTVLQGGAAVREKQIQEPTHVLVMSYEQVRMHSRLMPYGDIRLKRCWKCDSTLSEGDPTADPRKCEHCQKSLNKKAWRTVIVDEGHRMKDPRAKQTRAIWALATKETRFRFVLTGTPIASNPADMWSALHFIDLWGTHAQGRTTKSKYLDRYCQTSINPFGGLTVTGLRPEMRKEFFEIIDPHMRRMPKDAVLPWLPKKTYMQRYVQQSPKERKAYDQMERTMIAQLESGILVATNPLTALIRLSQFASAYAEIVGDGQVRLSRPSCKVDDLCEFVDDLNGDPLVVFAESRQLIDMSERALSEKGVGTALIVGGQTNDQREAAKLDFQEGRKQVILCTIAAGGVGLTLTRSPIAFFMQRSWSLIENVQAEDRVHRIGSEIHDKITIIDQITENTVDLRKLSVLDDKGESLEEIVRDRAFLAKVLGADAPARTKRSPKKAEATA